MASKLHTTLLISVALVLWTAAATLSSVLGASKEPSPARGSLGQSAAPLPEAIQKLRQDADAAPSDARKRVVLAQALSREGLERRDSGMLMQALLNYEKALSLEPELPEALVGLANLSVQQGLHDKAENYFERYLKARPEDKKAKVDYALSQLEMGRTDRALELLDQIVAGDPDFFPARLSRALALRVSGRLAEAKAEGERARESAPDEEGKVVVTRFLNGLQEQGDEGASDRDRLTSPAIAVKQFFSEHPIIGPKLRRVVWPDAETVRVEVENFPVSAMPEFAKQKLLSAIDERFKALPQRFKIELYDTSAKKVQLEVTAGGRASK